MVSLVGFVLKKGLAAGLILHVSRLAMIFLGVPAARRLTSKEFGDFTFNAFARK